MTKIRSAYNQWAETYDTMANKTRDLEAVALRKSLAGLSFESVLEIGCGTGKNTMWLMERAKSITCVDFSSEMINKAKEKLTMQEFVLLRQTFSMNGPLLKISMTW